MKPFDLSDSEISRWLANFVEPEDTLRNPAIVPRDMLFEDGYRMNGNILMSPKGMWGWSPKGWGPRGMVEDDSIAMGILKDILNGDVIRNIVIQPWSDGSGYLAVNALSLDDLSVQVPLPEPAALNRAILNAFYILSNPTEAETVN